jgi:prepilin peptidase CpaA
LRKTSKREGRCRVLSGRTDTSILLYAILAISAGGALTDLICGKIFNWLTIPALIGGILVSAWISGWAGMSAALLATFAGLALYGWIFVLGAMGAGDVKFLMALGAWGGLRFVFQTALLGVAVGGVLAVLMLVFSGKMPSFIRRMHHFLLTMVLKELEAEKPKIDHSMTMPFGIPIAIAAAWVALGHPFEWLGVTL